MLLRPERPFTPNEENADVKTQDAGSASDQTAEGSSATAEQNEQLSGETQADADSQQSTESTESSTDTTDGDADQTGAESTESGDEQATEAAQGKAGKNRTARRFDKLLTENRALREQLKSQMLNPAKAEHESARATAGDTIQRQTLDAETPEAIAQQYHAATDPAVKQQLADKYERAKEQRVVERAKRELREEQQREQMATVLAGELDELNQVAPIFKEGTSQIDEQSPLVKSAREAAAERGQKINDWQSFLFWGRKAALKLALQGSITATLRANEAQQRLRTANAKQGLEGTQRGSTGAGGGAGQSQAAKLAQLAKRAESGDVAAQREYTRLQLAHVIRG